jgi:hypothetical protein
MVRKEVNKQFVQVVGTRNVVSQLAQQSLEVLFCRLLAVKANDVTFGAWYSSFVSRDPDVGFCFSYPFPRRSFHRAQSPWL